MLVRKTNNVNNNCSMGYRTKINNKKGYITSAHCFTGVGASSTGGVVTKYQRSGKVDAAFVETTASYEPSNVLKYPSNGITELNIAKCPTLKVGGTIAHNGVATNYQSGTILSTNYAANYDGVSYSNLIAVNYTSSGGDSGGVVFVPTTSGGLIAGIHMGKINDTIKVVVNANNITEAFNDEWY